MIPRASLRVATKAKPPEEKSSFGAMLIIAVCLAVLAATLWLNGIGLGSVAGGAVGIFFATIWLVLGVAFYFLPAIVASNRKHPNATAILVLNLLAGWTFVGWVVAMVWAFTSTRG